MSRFKGSRARILAAMAFLLGSLLLLSCQPSQPVPLGTPKTGEKGAEKAAATATKPAAVATPAKAVEKPVRGGILRIAGGDAGSLDPNTQTSQVGMASIYENLIEPDKDAALTKEGLAKDWAIGSDGKSITFKLREGVKFQDGTDFDAAAVKFNVDRMRDPATASPFREYYAAVASAEVVDNLTVRFNLSQPDVLILPRLAGGVGGMMVSPAAVKKYGKDFPRNPVGTGPFQFAEWVQGDRITLKRFDGYWKKDKDGNQLPYLDRVVFQIFPDPTVGAINFRTGQVEVMTAVPEDQRPLVKNDPNLTFHTRTRANTTIMLINTKRLPFDNKALRQAVALALDREGMAGVLGATAAPSFFNPVERAYGDGKSEVFPSRDVAKAKAKMAEAGYPAGGLKVMYTSGNTPDAVKQAEITKANLAEIGIEAGIETLAGAAHNTKVRINLDYQIASSSTNITVGDPGHYLSNIFHSRGSRNWFGPYSNPLVDQALDKALVTYDQKERAALYQQAARVLVDDAPFVSLYLTEDFSGVNKKVRNYTQYWDHYERTRDVWLAP